MPPICPRAVKYGLSCESGGEHWGDCYTPPPPPPPTAEEKALMRHIIDSRDETREAREWARQDGLDLREEGGPTDHLPTIPVTRGVEYTTDGQLLVDGSRVPPGQWRLQMPDGAEMILTVADPPAACPDQHTPHCACCGRRSPKSRSGQWWSASGEQVCGQDCYDHIEGGEGEPHYRAGHL